MACVCVLLALAHRVDAQQTEDVGIWLGGFANGRLPPSWNNDQGSWRLWMDVQVRFGDDASVFSQGVLRPGIGYTLGRGWTVWGGYAYIRTDPPYSTSTTTEQRIWEQAIWSGAIGATAVSSRTRMEQRFVSTTRCALLKKALGSFTGNEETIKAVAVEVRTSQLRRVFASASGTSSTDRVRSNSRLAERYGGASRDGRARSARAASVLSAHPFCEKNGCNLR